MSTMLQDLGIDQLSVEDRLRLVHEIWDSIASEKNPPGNLSESQRGQLLARMAEDDKAPEASISWEEIKARVLTRHRP